MKDSRCLKNRFHPTDMFDPPPYAQKISLAHEFVPLGFLPLCFTFSHRESFALLGRHFGNALALRKNNPRIIPEAYPLANIAVPNCSLPCDVIVDESSAPYPYDEGFQLKELTVEGYPSLLRIERGRVRHREVFGNMRLEYGFFRLQANDATYLLGSDHKKLVGAIGFTHDKTEQSVRVFELISFPDQAIRFLLVELERKCREEWDVQYIEIDVSGHSPHAADIARAQLPSCGVYSGHGLSRSRRPSPFRRAEQGTGEPIGRSMFSPRV